MKKRFYTKFRISGIGTFERYRWYRNYDSFVKSVAREFEKEYPRMRIFVEVLEFKEVPLKTSRTV